MSRRRTAAQLQRQATLAQARETYYKNKPPSTLTTVRARKTDNAVYSSYLIIEGTDSADFKLPISDAAKEFFGGLAALGLRDPATITDPVAPKPRNFTPAMVKAMIGAATPTASNSPWNTRVIKYSAATNGNAQAHHQAPISSLIAKVTYDDIDTRANTILTNIKTKLGNLDYASFVLTPESFNSSKI